MFFDFLQLLFVQGRMIYVAVFETSSSRKVEFDVPGFTSLHLYAWFEGVLFFFLLLYSPKTADKMLWLKIEECFKKPRQKLFLLGFLIIVSP